MQVAEAAASPPTEPERAIYREPPSPSAPFVGTAAMSPPIALLTIDRATLSLKPRATPPWPAAAAAAAQALGQDRTCARAVVRSRRHAVIAL
jgi:hypothetical protein